MLLAASAAAKAVDPVIYFATGKPWAYWSADCEPAGILPDFMRALTRESGIDFDVRITDFGAKRQEILDGDVHLRLLPESLAAASPIPMQRVHELGRERYVLYTRPPETMDPDLRDVVVAPDWGILAKRIREAGLQHRKVKDFDAAVDVWHQGGAYGMIGPETELLFAWLDAGFERDELPTATQYFTETYTFYEPLASKVDLDIERLRNAIGALVRGGLLNLLKQRHLKPGQLRVEVGSVEQCSPSQAR